ncbi:MAG: glycoside hydrolase family 16 protein [Rubrivivax sp.]
MKAPGAALLLAACASAAAANGLFFDDFGETLAQGGWRLRSASGHPGVPGAQWRADALGTVADPEQPGNRLLRLRAQSDGTGAGTVQAQICHARKYLHGTYAARVRFADQPLQGADGDPIVQAFYAVSPLAHAFDPNFSEVDWEYLPNGGWGSDKQRLYGISWQTVRVEPWQSHNGAHEEFGSFDGWHVLLMQVEPEQVRLFVDGRQVARHAGRNVPVVPMSINFSLWFAPAGLLPPGGEPRVYTQDVDWVFHAAQRTLAPAEVAAQVAALRREGRSRVDTVPEAQPPLASDCDF